MTFCCNLDGGGTSALADLTQLTCLELEGCRLDQVWHSFGEIVLAVNSWSGCLALALAASLLKGDDMTIMQHGGHSAYEARHMACGNKAFLIVRICTRNLALTRDANQWLSSE